MAVRSATRRYADLPAFLRDYAATMRMNAIQLPPGTIEGEAAPEMKIDLVLPLVGRLGPISAQVVSRLPDGGTALRVPEWPPEVMSGFEQVQLAVEQLKTWLIESGQVLPPGGGSQQEVSALRRRVQELESRARVTMAAPNVPAASGSPAGGSRERGLVIPDVSTMEATLAGALGDRSMRDAMMELAIAKANGLLTLELPDGRVRWGLWFKGGPVGWRAEPIDESEVLGVLLYRANQITREQLAQSIEIMEATGVRQGEALIEMGVIQFAQLVAVLQKQAEFVLQRALRETQGAWSFHVLDDLPEKYLNPPIRVASLLFRALRNHAKDMPAEDLAGSLRESLDRYVYVAAGAEKMFEEMKLTVEEQAFIKIIVQTSYRLRELFAVSTLSRTGTAGMVWALSDLNLIEFREEEGAGRIDDRVAREVAGRMSAVSKGTHFDVLDVHWICTTAEVEAAYKKLQADFRVERTSRWGEKYATQVEQIREAMEQAHRELSSDARRREYRASVIERTKIEQSAEMLAKKGDMAIMKESLKEALDCFVKANELLPTNAEYREGLQRARALAR